MTLAELNRNGQRAKPAATARVPASPHQADQPRSGRGALAAPSLATGGVLGQLAGTFRRPAAVRATASGAAMSSIGTGRNTPASRSAIPGSTQALTRATVGPAVPPKL